jgi:hypothetical protein
MSIALMNLFAGKKQNVWPWYWSQVPDYQDFQIVRCWINRILLYTYAG